MSYRSQRARRGEEEIPHISRHLPLSEDGNSVRSSRFKSGELKARVLCTGLGALTEGARQKLYRRTPNASEAGSGHSPNSSARVTDSVLIACTRCPKQRQAFGHRGSSHAPLKGRVLRSRASAPPIPVNDARFIKYFRFAEHAGPMLKKSPCRPARTENELLKRLLKLLSAELRGIKAIP